MKEVAFVIPTCSYNLPDEPVLNQHLYKIFLTSLRDNCPDFIINLYLGYNTKDKIYNDTDNQMLVKATCILQPNIKFNWFEMSDDTIGKPTWIWNELSKKAVQDGNDYLFVCGDDIVFPKQKEWLGVMIKKLKSNNNMGIAGGDSGNPNLPMTQFLISKKHLEIFDFVFPSMIHNHYCDNWILEVYPKKYIHYCEQYKLLNMGGQPRYTPKDDKGLYKMLVKRYRPNFIRYISLIQ